MQDPRYKFVEIESETENLLKNIIEGRNELQEIIRNNIERGSPKYHRLFWYPGGI